MGEILGLDASAYLDDLLSFGLIYRDPSDMRKAVSGAYRHNGKDGAGDGLVLAQCGFIG